MFFLHLHHYRRVIPILIAATLLIGCGRDAPPKDAEPPSPAVTAAPTNAYVGSERCAQCHAQIYAEWKDSHHALAQRPIDPAQDRSAFEPPREIRHGSQVSHADVIDGKLTLRTTGSDGSVQAFVPSEVIGVHPLWQCVIDMPNGRRQATELAYDPVKHEWFNVFGDEDRRPEEWGHWTNRGMNWNAMCATCHTTDYKKNYNPKTDSYDSTYRELGVGCDSCHGPMQDHVTARLAGDDNDPAVGRMTNDNYFNTCGACHARRTELTGAFQPGDAFLDHFDPTIPDLSDIFYADGQVREEDFEFIPFMLSYMHGQGVRCTDCHSAHTGKLIATGNDLCLRCHKEPVTNKIAIVPETHSHHAAGQPGSFCVDCHMPRTPYMQRHLRRDHGMTIPDPLLTKQHGIPNACNRCHQDKDADWAIGYVDEWYGQRMVRRSRTRAQLLARIRDNDLTACEPLLKVLEAEENPTWRAVILKHLTRATEQDRNPEQQRAVLAALRRHLQDESPLVQAIAVEALEPLAQYVAPEIAPKLDSPNRLVRTKAAWALRNELDLESTAGEDLLTLLEGNADQPGGALQWAHFYSGRDEPEKALEWFAKAIEWDPAVPPYRYLYAQTLSGLGRHDDAIAQLVEASKLAPNDALYPYSLGLTYAELELYENARDAILAAIARDSSVPRFWYNLALTHQKIGDFTEAIEAILRAEQLAPENPHYPYTRATICMEAGKPADAQAAMDRLQKIAPEHPALRRR